MLRVTADTNVYISALNFGGNPERLLRLARLGIVELAISDSIFSEIERVLHREKFGWPEAESKKALQEIAGICKHVQPAEVFHIITEDPEDNRILECAAASNADYIVSGDNHLLQLGQFRNMPILKVAAFLKRL